METYCSMTLFYEWDKILKFLFYKNLFNKYCYFQAILNRIVPLFFFFEKEGGLSP